jgi:hypothetical protein
MLDFTQIEFYCCCGFSHNLIVLLLLVYMWLLYVELMSGTAVLHMHFDVAYHTFELCCCLELAVSAAFINVAFHTTS